MRRIPPSRSTVLVGCFAFLFLVADLVVIPLGRDCAQAAAAQEKPETNGRKGPQIPLVVIHVASVERLLGDVDYLFKTAGRPELSEVVSGLVENNLGDLKGMDRGKPFGLMLFLKSGLTPRPTPVGFLPVNSIDDLMKTVSRGPLKAKKVDGKDDRYDLVGPRRTFQVRLLDGFAFVGNDEEIMDGELPDPVRMTEQLSSRYDIAASVNLKSMPEGMKAVFLDFLRASAETELQRRDDEPEGRHRLRRANGLSLLELIDQLLTQGENLTVGWNTSEKSRNAVVEFHVNAAPDSKLAKYLKDIGGKRSYFSSLLNRHVPLTASLSWMMDARGKKVLDELLKVAQEQLSSQLPGNQDGTKGADADDSVRRLFKPLAATAQNGHADFFVQFIGEPPGKFVLIGGMRVVDADALGLAVTDILRRIADSPNLADLKLNADSHQGIAFHRIEGKKIRRQDERLYGKKPGLFFGAGGNAVWFAVGGDNAMPELKKAMDQVAERSENAADGRDSNAPLQIVANLSSWVGLDGPADAGTGPQPVRELAREAFSKGADRLRIDIRPTDNGARLRIELDEGFIRLIGLGLARRYDRRRR